jgi:hypothetical protein
VSGVLGFGGCAGRRNGWEDDVGRAPVERPEHNVRLLQLIKHHLRDWLWVGVMIVLELVVYLVWPPFHRFVSKTKMQEYLYPHSPETVPTWAIGVCMVFFPSWFFLGLTYRLRVTETDLFCWILLPDNRCAGSVPRLPLLLYQKEKYP